MDRIMAHSIARPPQPVGSVISLVIATRNDHKVEEIRAILGGSFLCRTLKELPGAPEVVEDAPTFAGNATKKAVALAKWLSASGVVRERAGEQLFALADDSGLEADALRGKPGVHSARFAALDYGTAGNSSSTENNAKLLRLLQDVPREKRTGRFRCVLALTPVLPVQRETSSPACAADEFELQTELFEGACEGWLEFSPRGGGGFGYDPLFVPQGYEQTFAELGEAVKNQFSHRAKALTKLKHRLELLLISKEHSAAEPQ